MARKWAAPFSVLLGLGLAISVPWLLAVWTDDASSDGRIAVTVVVALLISVAVSFTLIFVYLLAAVIIPKLLQRAMVWVTFKTVRRAIARQNLNIVPSGIMQIDDNVGVGLPVGLRDGVMRGHHFVVLNSSSQVKWGTLEVVSVNEGSCVCSVSDRINLEFWNNLERKMLYDPSFPEGITVRREIPEEPLLDWLQALLK